MFHPVNVKTLSGCPISFFSLLFFPPFFSCRSFLFHLLFFCFLSPSSGSNWSQKAKRINIYFYTCNTADGAAERCCAGVARRRVSLGISYSTRKITNRPLSAPWPGRQINSRPPATRVDVLRSFFFVAPRTRREYNPFLLGLVKSSAFLLFLSLAPPVCRYIIPEKWHNSLSAENRTLRYARCTLTPNHAKRSE